MQCLRVINVYNVPIWNKKQSPSNLNTRTQVCDKSLDYYMNSVHCKLNIYSKIISQPYCEISPEILALANVNSRFNQSCPFPCFRKAQLAISACDHESLF